MRVALLVVDEAGAMEIFAINAAVVGDVGVGEEIFEALIVFRAVDTVDHANPAIDGVGIVLEEGAWFGGFGSTFKVADVVLTGGVDEPAVDLSKKHVVDFGGVFAVLGLVHGSGDGAVIFAEGAGAIVFDVKDRSIFIGDTDGEEVTTVDGVGDGNIAAHELFHVAGFIGVNASDRIAVVILDVKVADAVVVFALFGGELVVFVGGDFAVSFLVDADEVGPRTVLFAGKEFVVAVFDGLTVVVGFEAVVANARFVEGHGSSGSFVDAEFVHDDTGFVAAARFNFGALGDYLPDDG